MTKIIFLLMTFALLCCTSCSDDNSHEVIIGEDIRTTDVSGVTINYTKDLEIGGKENEIIFEKYSEIIFAGGRKTVKTLDCCGLAAVALDGAVVDTTEHVENVTIINRATITVHTKDLVERYKDLVATPESPDRPYYYLRVLGLYVGRNCTVINKGVINVYFDHDTSNTSTIYTVALTGDDGSTVINDGEINFFGTGSMYTRFRGIATQGDNVTAINNGVMTSNVEMVEDQRMITTGGEFNNITNNGIMRMRGPGNIYGMTRFGNSNIVNNKLIEITHVDMPNQSVEQKSCTAAGIFSNIPLTSIAPPMVNRGIINMKAETTSNSNAETGVHGIWFDLMPSLDVCFDEISAINEGIITTTQTGPKKINMAEAAFSHPGKKRILNVKMGYWKTTLRDFSQQLLFYGNNIKFDFIGGELELVKGSDYVDGTPYSVAPEDLLKYKGNSGYSGYENMTIVSKDVLDWDQDNKKASLSTKK